MQSIIQKCVGNSKRAMLALLVVVGMQSVVLHQVQAYEYTQTDNVMVQNAAANGIFYTLPAGIEGTATQITIGYQGNWPTPTQVAVAVLEYNSYADYLANSNSYTTIWNSKSTSSVSTQGSNIFVTSTYTTPIYFNPSKVYVLASGYFFGGSGSTVRFIGGNTGNGLGCKYGNGTIYPNTMDDCQGISDMYVIIPNTNQPIPTIGFDATTQTRFTDVSITGTSTITIEADYFLEQSEINTTVSAFNPAQVNFGIALRPSTSISQRGVNINSSLQGTSSASTTFNSLADGTYDLNITFYNNGVIFGQDRPFKDSYIYTSFVVASGTLQSIGTPEYYDGTTPLNPETTKPCSITEIGGCIINAFSYLFYPSSSGIENITGLYGTLSTKFPFAYFTDFNDSVTSIFTNSTTESLSISVPFGTFGTIDLLSAEMIEDVPFTPLIRELLGAIIWLMMAYTIYRRTLRIFNTETT